MWSGATWIITGIVAIVLGVVIKLLSFLWWILVALGILAIIFGLVQGFSGKRQRRGY